MEQREKKKKSTGDWRLFVKLIRQTNPSKWALGVALVMSLATTLVSLVIPLFTKNLVNSLSLSSLSAWEIGGLVVAFIAQAVSSGVSIYLLNKVGQKVVADLRYLLWKKILVLPFSYYDNNQTGETTSRMTNDTGVVKTLITEHLTNFLSGVISIIGAISILLYLDWKMTLIMLVAVPLSALVLMPLGRQMHKISRGLQNETATFTSVLNQVLSEIRLVKSSNSEPLEYNRGKTGITNLYQYGLREARVQAMISPLVGLVLMTLMVVIIGYGGVRVSSGALTAGDLVAFLLYLFQIVIPMTQITQFFTQLQKTMGATERIISILGDDEEDHTVGRVVQDVDQPIVVDHVTFGYKESEAVLQDLHFTIQPGEVTAIVGPSGGGKTTMFSLLERFYQPQSGQIRLGADDIAEYSLPSWRSRIGYVSQESPLMAGTIRENICYGMEREVGDAELQQVAEMAYADGFIDELPEKYETEVGERGIKLS
ncbi:MAG: ABC transporter ATP-binding protein, partial [Tumebacillaceae bacterium]